jgi:hypothetical protein
MAMRVLAAPDGPSRSNHFQCRLKSLSTARRFVDNLISMSEFRDAVDVFLSQDKRLVGISEWKETPRYDGLSCFWLLAEAGRLTSCRLHIVAYPRTPWQGFVVMVDFDWLGRQYPVTRLNLETSGHEHFNRPPRPPGMETSVIGPRAYLWEHNRSYFRPDMLGLPFATRLERRHHNLHNAIRYICGKANIDPVDTKLPDYPQSPTLV